MTRVPFVLVCCFSTASPREHPFSSTLPVQPSPVPMSDFKAKVCLFVWLMLSTVRRELTCRMVDSLSPQNPLAKRQAESARIRDKYPDRIPIIVEHAAKDRTGLATIGMSLPLQIPAPLPIVLPFCLSYSIDKNKYLVPADLTIGQFVLYAHLLLRCPPPFSFLPSHLKSFLWCCSVIRKRIALAQSQSLFLFVNDKLPPASALMSAVYKVQQTSDASRLRLRARPSLLLVLS